MPSSPWNSRKASGKGGGPYAARYNYVFDAWLRQRGKSLFAKESVGLGFTVDDAKEWFDYWEKLRKAGRHRCRRRSDARPEHHRHQLPRPSANR